MVKVPTRTRPVPAAYHAPVRQHRHRPHAALRAAGLHRNAGMVKVPDPHPPAVAAAYHPPSGSTATAHTKPSWLRPPEGYRDVDALRRPAS
ncbi:hypothetical protein J2T22_001655 [Pseudarthrobacter defluvii]|uniref:Uncharacterized protein n=1 Tax=Pseudarthrobacter defluvii TaxID=410837 RepID=A0ABT9UFQ3_9MICC|nr:hypothetical protein [Pseudarthrobacter defluvii]